MGQLPKHISFETWLDYLFGYPIGPSGFREAGDDWWEPDASPGLTVRFLTELFERPEIVLSRYPDDQINGGLWFLVAESGYLDWLLQPPVSWNERARGLWAIGSLYSRLFARVCANHLGHLDRGPEPSNPLNSICYMWWDLFPTWGGPSEQEAGTAAVRRGSGRASRRARRARSEAHVLPGSANEVILSVMAQTLQLDSEPCREGALHGLGHWHLHHSQRVVAIIDEWLGTEPRTSPVLHQYALQARSGCVL